MPVYVKWLHSTKASAPLVLHCHITNYARFLLSFMPTAVPVPTVDQLIKELKDVTAWYVLGASLRIPITQLESIKLNNASEGLEKQKTSMFHFWLQFNANASWKEIVQVLELNDYFALAEKVKRKYVLRSSLSTSQDEGMIFLLSQ